MINITFISEVQVKENVIIILETTADGSNNKLKHSLHTNSINITLRSLPSLVFSVVPFISGVNLQFV
jgi:hypothetical protein